MLTAAAGVFTLTGEAAALRVGRVLSAAAGVFTLVGQAISFVMTGPSQGAEAGPDHPRRWNPARPSRAR